APRKISEGGELRLPEPDFVLELGRRKSGVQRGCPSGRLSNRVSATITGGEYAAGPYRTRSTNRTGERHDRVVVDPAGTKRGVDDCQRLRERQRTRAINQRAF